MIIIIMLYYSYPILTNTQTHLQVKHFIFLYQKALKMQTLKKSFDSIEYHYIAFTRVHAIDAVQLNDKSYSPNPC